MFPKLAISCTQANSHVCFRAVISFCVNDYIAGSMRTLTAPVSRETFAKLEIYYGCTITILVILCRCLMSSSVGWGGQPWSI